MSNSGPIQWYHFQGNLIWLDGNFKQKTVALTSTEESGCPSTSPPAATLTIIRFIKILINTVVHSKS